MSEIAEIPLISVIPDSLLCVNPDGIGRQLRLTTNQKCYTHIQMARICSGGAGLVSPSDFFEDLDGGGGASFSIHGAFEILFKSLL